MAPGKGAERSKVAAKKILTGSVEENGPVSEEAIPAQPSKEAHPAGVTVTGKKPSKAKLLGYKNITKPNMQQPNNKKKKKKRFSKMRYTEINGSYKRYVFEVLKQVHPDLGLSMKTMTIMDELMNDMFERIAGEAAELTKHAGKETLSSREIEVAVKLLLPGELAEYATSEGVKAVSNYVKAVKGDDD